jgi:lipoate-protein ligase A
VVDRLGKKISGEMARNRKKAFIHIIDIDIDMF